MQGHSAEPYRDTTQGHGGAPHKAMEGHYIGLWRNMTQRFLSLGRRFFVPPRVFFYLSVRQMDMYYHPNPDPNPNPNLERA